MDLGIPTWPHFDEEGFRRRYGQIDTLDRIVVPDGGDFLKWDTELVNIVATLFFTLSDVDGFEDGKPAYPDVVQLIAPELPEPVRASYRNKFASNVS